MGESLHSRDVYVFIIADGTDGGSDNFCFKNKFLERTSDELNAKNCFDPSYNLPSGERASSILDWERKQLLRVAASNSLTINYVYTNKLESELILKSEPPNWYQDEALRVPSRKCCVIS